MKRLSLLVLAAVAIFLLAGAADAKLYHFQIGGVDHIGDYDGTEGLLWTKWKDSNGRERILFNRDKIMKVVARAKVSVKNAQVKTRIQPAVNPAPVAAAKKVETPNRGLTSTNDLQSPPFHNGFQAQKNAPKIQSASVPQFSADQNIASKTSSSSRPAVAPVIVAQKQGEPASKVYSAAIAPRSGYTPAVTPETNRAQKPLAVTTPKVRPEGSRYTSSSAVTPEIQKPVASAPQNFRPGLQYTPAVTPELYAKFRPVTRLVASTEKDIPVDGGTLTVSRQKYVIYDRDLDGNPVIREREVTRKQWVNRPKGGEVKKYFAWSPGQVLPPDWTQRVGHRMNGIDPATGSIMEFPIPHGVAAYCDNRGNAAGVIGKYTAAPEGAQLLAEMPKKKEKTS